MTIRDAAWTVLLLSSAFSQAGFGYSDVIDAEQEFHVIDADNDGAIGPAEAESNTRYSLMPVVFDELDLDGSGAIEYREWDRARAYLRFLDSGGGR